MGAGLGVELGVELGAGLPTMHHHDTQNDRPRAVLLLLWYDFVKSPSFRQKRG